MRQQCYGMALERISKESFTVMVAIFTEGWLVSLPTTYCWVVIERKRHSLKDECPPDVM